MTIDFNRAKADQVKITLGEYSLNSDVEPLSPVQVGVSEIFVHPYFKFTPQADRYDVAVLRLDRYVPYEPHISPICLPEKGDDFLGDYAWAAGWGAMQAGPVLWISILHTLHSMCLSSSHHLPEHFPFFFKLNNSFCSLFGTKFFIYFFFLFKKSFVSFCFFQCSQMVWWWALLDAIPFYYHNRKGFCAGVFYFCIFLFFKN